MGARSSLTVTGVPGWLTHAFLASLRAAPLRGTGSATALVHHAVVVDDALRAAYPNVTAWHALDLAAPGDLRPLLDGAETVVHAAGVIHVRTPREWDDVNTRGTIALAVAAKAAGVKRFVFLSSNAAGGASGADDVLTGRMPLVGGGAYRRSVTHVENLVQAVRLAVTEPRAAGETYYVVDDEIATTRSIVEAMAEALGVAPRFLRLPAVTGSVAYAADRMLEAMGRYSGPVHLVGESNWHVAISSAKAKRELGYAPARSLREGMREAVAWCRETGLL